MTTKTLHQKAGLCECELLSCKHEPGRCTSPAKGRKTVHGTTLCLGCTALHAERFLKPLPPPPPKATVFKLGDRRVDVKLYSTETTRDVYWSPRGPDGHGGFNSYVLAECVRWPTAQPTLRLGLARVHLYSINGAGEVRWEVEAYRMHRVLKGLEQGRQPRGDDEEFYGAFKHFGLTVDVIEEE